MSDSKKELFYDKIPFNDELFPIRINWSLCPASLKDDSVYLGSWHEQLEILYFIEGKAAVECGFRRYICDAGDIVIINPCESHTVFYHSGSPCFHCIMLDPRLYGAAQNDLVGIKYLAQMSNRRLHFNNLVSGNNKAREILLDLIGECRDARTAFEVAVKGDVLRLLAELFRSELRAVRAADEIRRDTVAYMRVAPALTFIAEYYTRPISLEELAKACCINTSYFCRRFREVTGVTALNYINEYRISKAEALLLTTDLSVAEVAASVGFTDGCYFSRRFKELRGFPPSRLRSNIVQSDAQTLSK